MCGPEHRDTLSLPLVGESPGSDDDIGEGAAAMVASVETTSVCGELSRLSKDDASGPCPFQDPERNPSSATS